MNAPAGEGRLELAPVSPNPTTGPASLRFTLPRSGLARLDLIDVTGRRTRTLLNQALPAGPHEVHWDGRDTQGAPAGAGLYWVRLESGGVSAVRRLVRIR